MFGLLFGTVCLFGLLGMARRAAWRRHAWAHGYGGHHAFGGGCHGGFGAGFGGPGFGGRGRRGWRNGGVSSEAMARAAGEVLKRRLDITDEQEPIVDNALGDVHGALQELSKELKDTRTALADAVRGETVDDAAIAAVFARQDDALARGRRQLLSAYKQVHAVLTPKQRTTAADWIASRDLGWM